MSNRTRDKFVARQRTVDVVLEADNTNGRGILSIIKAGVKSTVAIFDDSQFSPQFSALPAATADLGSAASPYRNAFLSGLLRESASDALTGAGTNQGNALALTKEVNRFTTVAAGTGASLPAAAAGLTIVVINSGANPLQVYGAGTDTINDVATATGVAQMPGSVVIYGCTVAGKWYTEGLASGFSGSLATVSFADALAAVGTTQATGLQLAAMVNKIATGASTTGVNLPASAPGLMVVVINAVANAIHVYPFIGATDTINGAAAATGIIIGANTALTFYCTAAGVWLTGTSVMPQAQVSVIATAGVVSLTGAQAAGANDVIIDLTGQTGSQALNLPTPAQVVAAMHNAYVGQTYRCRIIQRAAFTATVTANGNSTVTGTATIGQGICREFLVTITDLTHVVFASVLAYAVTAA